MQILHIITMDEVAGCEGQDPIPEGPASLVEMAKCLRTDDTVHGDPTLLLECPNGLLNVVVKLNVIIKGCRRAVGVHVDQGQTYEARADVCHRDAGVPAPDDGHPRLLEEGLEVGEQRCLGLGPDDRLHDIATGVDVERGGSR